MIIGIKSDRILFPEGISAGYVCLSKGKILSAGPNPMPCDQLLDYTGKYVAPGFIDLHTHGGEGIAFSECSPEQVIQACDFHMRHGTTALLPTLSAGSMEEMEQGVIAVAQAMDSEKSAATIVGVHMEGPYLSQQQCGAQRPGFITAPIAQDYQRMLQRWGKYIARWTYAPENDPHQTFCSHLTQNGILPSVGHSNARYEELFPAIQSGCTLVTHLYSCMSTITRDHGFRHLGVIETAFLLPEMDVEIIADGKHLPPELIRMILQIKGREHVALVTDSLPAAGLAQREGIMSGTPYIVEDGVAKLSDRSAFAGSIATADLLIRVLVEECGCSISDAVYMMTATPARILGLQKGRLEAGYDGDVVVFDDTITVETVFTQGIRRI